MTLTMKSILILLVVSQTARVSTAFDGKLVELNCSDNATCIDGLAKNLVKNLKQDKAVKLFDFVTIEPLKGEPIETGRSNPGVLAKFLGKHAIGFDVGPYLYRFSKSKSVPGAVVVDVMDGRSLAEEDETRSSEGSPRRRRHRVFQMILPVVLGMKTATTALFAISAVALLTFKAFFASKLALLVTGAMAAKRLLESFKSLQPDQSYLYSQYPVDFTNGGNPAYAVAPVGGASYGSQEIYSPSVLGSHSHEHEILQQNDATALQSQSALHIVNATRASDRWDGMRRKPMYYGPSRINSDTYSEYQ